MKLYLDANALISWVEGDGASSRLLNEAVAYGVRAMEKVTTSEISLAEVLLPSLRPDADEQARGHGVTFHELFSAESAVTSEPVTRDVLLFAASLRAHFGSALRLPDAIHLATAQKAGCTHVISGDRGLRPSPLFPFERIGNTEDDLRAFIDRMT